MSLPSNPNTLIVNEFLNSNLLRSFSDVGKDISDQLYIDSNSSIWIFSLDYTLFLDKLRQWKMRSASG